MAFFPKLIKSNDVHRIIWQSPDEIVVEMNGGTSALGEVIWRKPNQITMMAIMKNYIVDKLKIKYRDELQKEGIQVPPAKKKAAVR